MESGYLEGLDNVYEAFGFTLLVAGYAGPLVRLRETAGNTEQDFYPDAITGRIEYSAVQSWLDAAGASGLARVVYWYGQLGLGVYEQTTGSVQPPYNHYKPRGGIDMRLSSSLEMQAATGTYNTQGLYIRDFARNRQTASILMVHGSGAMFSPYMISWTTNASASNARLEVRGDSGGLTTGMRLAGRVADADGESVAALTSKNRDGGDFGVSISRVDMVAGIGSRRWRGETVSETFLSGTWPDNRPAAARLFTRVGNRFTGECQAVVLFTDYLTDAEDVLLEKRFAKLISPADRGVTRWW